MGDCYVIRFQPRRLNKVRYMTREIWRLSDSKRVHVEWPRPIAGGTAVQTALGRVAFTGTVPRAPRRRIRRTFRTCKRVDVSKILGHTSPIATANRYAHSFDQGKQQAVNAVSAALFKRAGS